MNTFDHPVILFDGICNFCNATVQFVIRHDPEGKFRFCPLQSETGKKIVAQYELLTVTDSFFLLKDDKLFSRSTAALMVARMLKGPVSFLYGFIIVPAFIRNKVYDIVAARRYKWFGKREECMIPTAEIQNRFLN